MSSDDSDWPVVAGNLRKARRKWGRFSRIIFQEGEYPRTSGRFYVAVVKSVLLFGSEMWVLTPRILRAIGSLHNWVARWISGRMPQRLRNRGWGYPPIEEALENAGLETIGIYITRRQNTVAQYIATRPIFDIAVTEERSNGSPALLRWWEQARIRFGHGGEADELELG